jgi:formylglycine-generating enzyme required for sulfatase activity
MHATGDPVKRVLAAAALLAACSASSAPRELPPIGQLVLYFDTDAPVPPSPGTQPGPSDPSPLFDALWVDVFPPGQAEPCGGCSREFALDAGKLQAQSVSVGLPLPVGEAGWRVRARMFRTGASLDQQPVPNATVEVVAELPAVEDALIAPFTLLLATDTVGQPSGTLDAPVAPTPGAPGGSQVGHWPAAARVDCAGMPRQGEACVPGGAFWMGNPRVPGSPSALVVLSPFYVQQAEVNVKEFRALAVSPWEGWDVSGLGGACTFTTAASADALPVNCASWEVAREYCQKQLGGDLPTEAQLEYLGGGLASSVYLWGDDDPSCSDAVWGHLWKPAPDIGSAAPCSPALTEPPAAAPADLGARPRDQLTLPGGVVVYDVFGGLREWALDDFQLADPTQHPEDTYWLTPGIRTNPRCTQASPYVNGEHSIKGGSYLQPASEGAAAGRFFLPGPTIDVGLRCVRSAGD